MGLISKAIGLVGGAARAAGPTATMGALGTVAGGIYGYASSDSMTSTGQFRGALGGAMAGGLLGGLGGMFGGGISRFAKGLATKDSPQRAAMKAFPGKAWGGLKSAGSFVKRHPYATGFGLATTGLTAAAVVSDINNRPEYMGQLAAETGVSSTGFDPGFGSDISQSSRQQFIDSTGGLVQAMHRNRH